MPNGTNGILLMMVIIIVLGTVLDDWAMIMLCTLLFVPIQDGLGVDTLCLGALSVVYFRIVSHAPPSGFVLFWLKDVLPSDVTKRDIYGPCQTFRASANTWFDADRLISSDRHLMSDIA